MSSPARISVNKTYVSADELPSGTIDGLSRNFFHLNYPSFIAIKAEPTAESPNAYYAFEPGVQNGKENFMITRFDQKDLEKANRLVTLSNSEAEEKLAVPLTENDIRRIHRTLSVAVAATHMVVNPASESAALERFDSELRKEASPHFKPEHAKTDPEIKLSLARVHKWREALPSA